MGGNENPRAITKSRGWGVRSEHPCKKDRGCGLRAKEGVVTGNRKGGGREKGTALAKKLFWVRLFVRPIRFSRPRNRNLAFVRWCSGKSTKLKTNTKG